MKIQHKDIRKITVNLPASLIDPLLQESGQGPTELLTELLQKEKKPAGMGGACRVARQGVVRYELAGNARQR